MASEAFELSTEDFAIEELKKYRENQKRINFLQRISIGKGLFLEVDTSRHFDGSDILAVLHRMLDGIPEEDRLNNHELEITKAYRSSGLGQLKRAYLSSYFRALKNGMKEIEDPRKQKLIRELESKVAYVVRSRTHRLYKKEQVAAVMRADKRLKAEKEIDALLFENLPMEIALNDVKSYDPNLELLLRMRYLEGKAANETKAYFQHSYSPRTLDRMRHEALKYLGDLLLIQQV